MRRGIPWGFVEVMAYPGARKRLVRAGRGQGSTEWDPKKAAPTPQKVVQEAGASAFEQWRAEHRP